MMEMLFRQWRELAGLLLRMIWSQRICWFYLVRRITKFVCLSLKKVWIIGLRFNLYKNSNNCSSSWSRDNLKSVTNEILHFMLHKYTRKRPILHVYMISLCMRGDKRRKKEKRNKEKETPSAPMKEKQKKKRAATG